MLDRCGCISEGGILLYGRCGVIASAALGFMDESLAIIAKNVSPEFPS